MKKIYDIMPPSEVKEKEQEKASCKAASRPIKKGWHPLFKLLILVFIVFAIFFYFYEGTAEVNIVPVTEGASGEEVVTIDVKEEALNYEGKIIPSVVFTDTRDYSQDYNATGVDNTAKKAKGTIRVYNAYNPPDSLSLKTGTHFESKEGYSYHALTAIKAPAGKIVSGKLEPGYVDIEIEADEAGEAYNIESTTFIVPKLKGTSYYTTTSAETKTAITGGTKSAVSTVLSDDLKNAETDFKTKYVDQAKKAFSKNIPDNYIVFNDKLEAEIQDFKINAKAGDKVNSFNASAKIKVQAEVLRKEDLDKFIEKTILSNYSAVRYIAADSIDFEVKEFKEEKDKKTIKIIYWGKTYWLPAKEFLLKNIAGKEYDYAISTLKNIPEVESAEIKLINNFGKNSLPNDLNKIFLDIKTD